VLSSVHPGADPGVSGEVIRGSVYETLPHAATSHSTDHLCESTEFTNRRGETSCRRPKR